MWLSIVVCILFEGSLKWSYFLVEKLEWKFFFGGNFIFFGNLKVLNLSEFLFIIKKVDGRVKFN